jgi:hypothetical protein
MIDNIIGKQTNNVLKTLKLEQHEHHSEISAPQIVVAFLKGIHKLTLHIYI